MKRFSSISLKDYTTFKVNTIARELIQIESMDDLKSVYLEGTFQSMHFILGGGSNVLFVNDFYDGIIVQVSLQGKVIKHLDDTVYLLECGAGEDWDSIVDYAVQNDLYGMENLSLIPGSVGASAVQNIGAYGVEAKDIIESVEYFDCKTGKVHTLTNSECDFSYRNSVFKNSLKGKAIITKVIYKLQKKGVMNISYPDILRYIQEHKLKENELQLPLIRSIICDIRRRKLPYPDEAGNAGSFFKNPIIPLDQFQSLLTKFTEFKGYPVGNNLIKLHAGMLIETAGWKGWTDKTGRYGVSEKHALVLVNKGNAKGYELYDVAQTIKKDIYNKFGIQLEEEVIIV